MAALLLGGAGPAEADGGHPSPGMTCRVSIGEKNVKYMGPSVENYAHRLWFSCTYGPASSYVTTHYGSGTRLTPSTGALSVLGYSTEPLTGGAQSIRPADYVMDKLTVLENGAGKLRYSQLVHTHCCGSAAKEFVYQADRAADWVARGDYSNGTSSTNAAPESVGVGDAYPAYPSHWHDGADPNAPDLSQHDLTGYSNFLALAQRYGTCSGIRPSVLLGVAYVESSYGANSASWVANSATALGPYQFVDGTWNSWKRDAGRRGETTTQTPDTNFDRLTNGDAMVAARDYLQALLTSKGGDLRAALLAYNGATSPNGYDTKVLNEAEARKAAADPAGCNTTEVAPGSSTGAADKDNEEGFGECFSWNPLSWFKGIPCVLRVAFIPSSDDLAEVGNLWGDMKTKLPFSIAYEVVTFIPSQLGHIANEVENEGCLELQGFAGVPGGTPEELCSDGANLAGSVGTPANPGTWLGALRLFLLFVVTAALAFGAWHTIMEVIR